jgi:hypothetical protein
MFVRRATEHQQRVSYEHIPKKTLAFRTWTGRFVRGVLELVACTIHRARGAGRRERRASCETHDH